MARTVVEIDSTREVTQPSFFLVEVQHVHQSIHVFHCFFCVLCLCELQFYKLLQMGTSHHKLWSRMGEVFTFPLRQTLT